ncbi:YihY/virulence factor BrkB family protein [Curtobacterium ammoniigenes]|uniref:YihY/virulence factor BrkB family protein n=1 Tax=Curtobacterium ammoniigenes TaxID=395387 RepID=UPI00082E346A|nr:YihY/virulence factor BrkB family protein [Curtobacterium ammoniigenes]
MTRRDERALQRRGVRAAIRRTYHDVARHRVIDESGALTFFGTLALFPAALTVMSTFAILHSKDGGLTIAVDVVGVLFRKSVAEHLRGPLQQLLHMQNPWVGLALGLVLTTWSLSSYATSFGRTMDSAYDVQEGRRIWRFRSRMVGVALLLMGGTAIALVVLFGTPSVARSICERQLHLPSAWALVWDIGKWPVLVAVLVVMVAVLYSATPIVRPPAWRWVSAGAAFAIIVWALATVGFTAYVQTLGGSTRSYGWLGGGILLLAYLYVSNFVLVVGGEFDTEMIRQRQLFADIDAVSRIPLPFRDTKRLAAIARWKREDEETAAQIRHDARRFPPDSDGEREAERELREAASRRNVDDSVGR